MHLVLAKDGMELTGYSKKTLVVGLGLIVGEKFETGEHHKKVFKKVTVAEFFYL